MVANGIATYFVSTIKPLVLKTGTTSFSAETEASMGIMEWFGNGSDMPLGPRSLFTTAARAWLDSKIDVESSTRINYESCIKVLSAFFGKYRLQQITPDMIRNYQKARTQDGILGRKASRSRTNIECCVLRQILKRARVWRNVADDYKDLRLLSPGPGRAMKDDAEERRLLAVAASRPEWHLCSLAIRMALASTMAAVEIKGLRFLDIDPNQRILYITKGKNKFRRRVLPLNEEMQAVIEELLKLAEQHNKVGREGYLFPFTAGPGKYDYSRPMVTWRHAWLGITKAAGMQGFRFHDLRHHAITRLLEDPNTSQETVMAITGHNTLAMLRKYSHVRINRMRQALKRLDRPKAVTAALDFVHSIVQKWG